MAKDGGADVAELTGILESDSGRRVLGEVSRVAPRLAALGGDLALGRPMMDALRAFQQGVAAVRNGAAKSLAEWADNRVFELVRDAEGPEAGILLHWMLAGQKKPTALREALASYIEYATAEASQRRAAAESGDIFGEPRAPRGVREILGRVADPYGQPAHPAGDGARRAGEADPGGATGGVAFSRRRAPLDDGGQRDIFAGREDAPFNLTAESAQERAARELRERIALQQREAEQAARDRAESDARQGTLFSSRDDAVGDSPTALRAQADVERFWQGVWRRVAPGASQRIGLIVRDPEVLADAGLLDRARLTGRETAAWISREETIALLDAAIEGKLQDATLLDVLHEAGHAWHETLGADTRAALERLWRAEIDGRTGPLFDEAGERRAQVNADVEFSAAEWFAERVAHTNLLWAKRRQAAGAHDGTILGRVAAGLRTAWLRVREASGTKPDILTAKLRAWLREGGAAQQAGEPAFSRRAPNGKESKLSDDLHAMVRTPEFKRWFGDWEKLEAKRFLEGDPVAVISGDEFRPVSGVRLEDRVADFYESEHGGAVSHPELGSVALTRRGVKDSIAHGLGRWKAAAFAAVPKVIEKGRVIERHKNWKGRGYDTAVLAAPVRVGDSDRIVVVVVKRDAKTNRFYLHEAYQKERVQGAFKTGTAVSSGAPGAPLDSTQNILADVFAVNPDSVSKAVDENGEPLVLWHGSMAEEFAQFDPNTIRDGFDEALLDGSALPTWSRVWRGAADVFDQVAGLEGLATAIRRHVDLQRRFQGALTAPFRRWAQTHGRAERKQAEAEFEAYQRRRDQERDPDWVRDAAGPFLRKSAAPVDLRSSKQLHADASVAGQELIALWDDAAARIQRRNMAMGVKVQGENGRWRDIGTVKDYFPRALRPEIMRALRNPQANRKHYTQLARALHTAGLIKDAGEARAFIASRFRTEASFDYLGNIEAARRVKLPTQLYDYSFAAAKRYLLGWTERMAQIEAFGQKTTSKSKDRFDVAMDRMIGNEPVQQYIQAVRDRAYGVRSTTAVARAAQILNTLATGLQLGNPVTVGVNLASGLAYNATHFGWRNATKGLVELRKLGKLIDDASEAGVILDDLMQIADDAEGSGSRLAEGAAKLTQTLLTVSGYNASERFVRAHGYATARAFLRQFLKAPGNRSMRRFFKRNHIDADKLVAEGGKGPETDRFYRRAVNDTQGGYRYDQVPVFTDTPIGRFLFKYQKWGTQALRNFTLNVLLPLQSGDPKAVWGAVRYLLTVAAIGAGIEDAKERIFGSAPKTASIEEIARTWSEDEKRGLALAADKWWRSSLAAGAFGILGNYAQIPQDIAERTRFKNPLDPPGLSGIKGVGDLTLTAFEQGALTLDDLNAFLAKQAGLYRTLKAASARAVEAVAADAAPAWAKDERNRQDLAWIGGVTRRWLSEVGIAGNRTSIARIGSTPLRPLKKEVAQALQRGDIPGGIDALKAYFASIPAAELSIQEKALKDYVRTQQPIRFDGAPSNDLRAGFMEWAQRRLPTKDFTRLLRLDATYRGAAEQLGLMKPLGEVSDADFEAAMQRRKKQR